MIKVIKLNSEQSQSLADRIEEIYIQDHIVATGLEVTELLKLNDCYKVNFTFERENCTIAQGRMYCTFGFDGDTNRVVDFEEAPPCN